MSYPFKTPPFSHQLSTWGESKDRDFFLVFWEQGTGKTKLTIDTAGWKFLRGEIDGILVLAPNGVHRNWITDELPTHLPDVIAKDAHTVCYRTQSAKTKWQQALLKENLANKGLSVLAMSYDAITTEAGKKASWDFLRTRKVMIVLDEAAYLKNPGADRTKVVSKVAKYAKVKWLLTGTPVPKGPFDVWSLVNIASPTFWEAHHLAKFMLFKLHFGVWKKGFNNGREFQQLVAYRRVDELSEIIKPISTRVLKEEVLDLPEKLYQRRYFELEPKQRKIYEEMKELAIVQLGEQEATAPLVISRMLRLHQISCGYLPTDDGEMVELLSPSENPRLKLLKDCLKECQGKSIIWARFRKDIDNIEQMLLDIGRRPVRYDGSTSDADRAEAIARFQGRRPLMDGAGRGFEIVPEDEQATDFVGNPQAAGTGLTLHAASFVYYYNNSFDLAQRLQSEDRAHRIGQKNNVTYIDLVGIDTIDEHIVRSLITKFDVATQILKDPAELRKWLQKS